MKLYLTVSPPIDRQHALESMGSDPPAVSPSIARSNSGGKPKAKAAAAAATREAEEEVDAAVDVVVEAYGSHAAPHPPPAPPLAAVPEANAGASKDAPPQLRRRVSWADQVSRISECKGTCDIQILRHLKRPEGRTAANSSPGVGEKMCLY